LGGQPDRSLILVNNAAEALSAADGGVERDHGGVVVVGRPIAAIAALMGPGGVGVRGILGQDEGVPPSGVAAIFA
jgi:hypothetical protein